MKKGLFILGVLLTQILIGQVGVNTDSPHPSAMLDVVSTEKGFLPPRLTDMERAGITMPATGLVIYNTDEKCLQVNVGTPTDPSWSCMGNSVPVTPMITQVPAALPTGIVLGKANVTLIASVEDTDYLPFTLPTEPATLAQDGDPGTSPGTAEPTPISFQGTLTTVGLPVMIPYTKPTAAAYALPAFSQTLFIPQAFTEDGQSRTIEFSYDAESLTGTSGFIRARIKSLGGDLNLKKLDVQTGIGSDLNGLLLSRFLYASDDAGGSENYDVRMIAGIPDRKFSVESVQDYTAIDNITDQNPIGGTLGQYHNFLYLPVVAEDGNVWLSNNLGSSYNNLNSPDFDFSKQAATSDDAKAFGSYFQFARAADGHELVEILTNGTVRRINNGESNALNDNPTHGLSIRRLNFIRWKQTDLVETWDASHPTNPCPVGFRLPTEAEVVDWYNDGNFNNINELIDSNLRLPTTGAMPWTAGQPNNNVPFQPGTVGAYWTSDNFVPAFPGAPGANTDYAYILNLGLSGSSVTGITNKGFGLPVRCIQD